MPCSPAAAAHTCSVPRSVRLPQSCMLDSQLVAFSHGPVAIPATGVDGGLPALAPGVLGSQTPRSPPGAYDSVPVSVAFRHAERCRNSGRNDFAPIINACLFPCRRFRCQPCGCPSMTRSEGCLLSLSCMTLPCHYSTPDMPARSAPPCQARMGARSQQTRTWLDVA